MSNAKVEIDIKGLEDLKKRLGNISKIIKKYDRDNLSITVEGVSHVEQYHATEFTTPKDNLIIEDKIITQIAKELDKS